MYLTGSRRGPGCECFCSAYLGWMAHLVTSILRLSTLTRKPLGWIPTGPDLLTDLRNMDYSVA